MVINPMVILSEAKNPLLISSPLVGEGKGEGVLWQ